ncbi:hypothetical protein Lepto7376_4220 [[Leptolyngbya] sp. PCC 7376]|uniref:HAD family hydrolase n=1 Tax=[Leptolyngbya] sp. PCC 7376 TaxID=111781 RepID=UPI00029EE059|nr:HAD family hydrolase [[Leptolyngbya] sp. PCC 7376]AFY40337.1 hypothetical protein Lepto7376_4220 [[Leptolyngbya] sp. PCC 7376]
MVVTKTIAFDFDGVLCDGLAEYFHSSAIACEEVFQVRLAQERLEQIRPAFYELRPVIETGWEMVALIGILLEGSETQIIWRDWQKTLRTALNNWGLTKKAFMVALDDVRDRQITTELDNWLSFHRFYDGMSACIAQLLADHKTKVYIITTKEARFAHQLLRHQDIHFPRGNIFGKETKQPKTQILKQLSNGDLSPFWFIEDRLKTLEKVQQDPELKYLKLFLATWGYNRPTDCENLVSKNITAVDLAAWPMAIAQFLAA